MEKSWKNHGKPMIFPSFFHHFSTAAPNHDPENASGGLGSDHVDSDIILEDNLRMTEPHSSTKSYPILRAP